MHRRHTRWAGGRHQSGITRYQPGIPDLARQPLFSRLPSDRDSRCDRRHPLAVLVPGGEPSLAVADPIVNTPWDGISCVWTLHQLPDCEVLRGALRQIAAVRERTGLAVWIFDFQRLRDSGTFPALLDVLDPSMTPVLLGDAIASEAAAFTHDELSSELGAAGLGDLRAGHARPIPWCQAFWASRADGRPGGSASFRPNRLPRRARADAAMLRSGFSAKPF